MGNNRRDFRRCGLVGIIAEISQSTPTHSIYSKCPTFRYDCSVAVRERLNRSHGARYPTWMAQSNPQIARAMQASERRPWLLMCLLIIAFTALATTQQEQIAENLVSRLDNHAGIRGSGGMSTWQREGGDNRSEGREHRESCPTTTDTLQWLHVKCSRRFPTYAPSKHLAIDSPALTDPLGLPEQQLITPRKPLYFSS